MVTSDPIADFLTRIRNAQSVKKTHVLIQYSKSTVALLNLMRSEGFIEAFKPKQEKSQQMLEIKLRYYERDGRPAINGLKRISKPGVRSYAKSSQIPTYLRGLGVCFVSTSKGLMTGRKARKLGLGGELLFYVW